MRRLALTVGVVAAGVGAYALFAAQGASETPQGILDSIMGKNVQTPDQIARVAQNAGFDASNILTAIAVALAESGGDANAYNPESEFFARHNIDGTGKGSVGLWQIFQHAHPEYSRTELEDPQTNAVAAFKVYSEAGNSFSPWSTFTSAAYQAHLDVAQTAWDALNPECSCQQRCCA